MLYEETKDPKYLKEVLSLHESKLYNKIRQQLNLQSDFVTKDIPNSILEKEKQLKLQIKTALNSENGLNIFITANKNWKNFIQTLKQDYPKYYQLRYASISESINFEDNLFSNEKTLIRYVYVNDKLYAFVIDNNKIQVHKLDAVALQNTLKNQENKTLTSNSFEQNHNLYNLLWKPFENSITKKSVVVVPDKDLFNLSFETFAVNKVNSLKKLVEKSLLNTYCISYNYSLLLINKNRTPKFFEKNFISFTPEFNDEMKTNYKIAINDSAFLDKTYLTLLPQPFATDLAKQYANLFNGESYLNENASKQVFQNKAKEHKIIHIGTHAESNNVTPQLSRLIFAKNINGTMASEDNSLYTYEIYNQNLSSNLAILTACETGKPTYQSGEGMISLAHAFNYAGSESILTSLWKIDEQSSALIIESFYKHLKKGLPKDKALQKAKLEYLSAAQGRTLNPQYWAGLVLIGDTSPIELSSDSDLVFWILALLVLIVITAIVIKRKRAA